jgi:hypothetical protein
MVLLVVVAVAAITVLLIIEIEKFQVQKTLLEP